jgi:hypothetical protein
MSTNLPRLARYHSSRVNRSKTCQRILSTLVFVTPQTFRTLTSCNSPEQLVTSLFLGAKASGDMAKARCFAVARRLVGQYKALNFCQKKTDIFRTRSSFPTIVHSTSFEFPVCSKNQFNKGQVKRGAGWLRQHARAAVVCKAHQRKLRADFLTMPPQD